MPGWRRSLSIAAVLLALPPAGAAAQSAGDEQYQDPFGNQPAQSTPAPAAPAPAPAAPAPAPAAPAPAPAPGTPAPPAPTQPAPSGARATPAELPRTGGDALLPALLGLALLSAGLALRSRARRDL